MGVCVTWLDDDMTDEKFEEAWYDSGVSVCVGPEWTRVGGSTFLPTSDVPKWLDLRDSND